MVLYTEALLWCPRVIVWTGDTLCRQKSCTGPLFDVFPCCLISQVTTYTTSPSRSVLILVGILCLRERLTFTRSKQKFTRLILDQRAKCFQRRLPNIEHCFFNCLSCEVWINNCAYVTQTYLHYPSPVHCILSVSTQWLHMPFTLFLSNLSHVNPCTLNKTRAWSNACRLLLKVQDFIIFDNLWFHID